MIQTETSLIGPLMDSLERCLTPEVAGRIAGLRAPEELQERLEVLADRSTEGLLTEDEKSEYEAYVHFVDFISILQARARKLQREVASR